MAAKTKGSVNDLGSLSRKAGSLAEEKEEASSSSPSTAEESSAESSGSDLSEKPAAKERPAAEEEGIDLDRPLGFDDTVREGQTDDESSITFSVGEELYKTMQKRFMRERISMKRALVGCINWWTESRQEAKSILQPYLDEILREKKEGEEALATRTTSIKMDSSAHMEYRISLIDDDLLVKDAVQAKVRWFCEKPREVRRHVRGHLPPN